MKVKVNKSYSKPTSESMKDYKKGRDWFSMVKKILNDNRLAITRIWRYKVF